MDRGDQGLGDFDIVMNYGHVQWETGDASGGSGGFGGTPAAVGYSAGTGDERQRSSSCRARSRTAPSSTVVPHALSTHSNIGLDNPGRYVYKVRSGSAGNSSTGVVGTVTSDDFPVEGAAIQVCPTGGGQCVYQARTGTDGSYSAVGVPAGTYDVTAYPPSGLRARPRTVRSTVVEDRDRVRVDIDLSVIDGLPSGTTLSPQVGSGSMPMVNWNDTLSLRTTGCLGGRASYWILSLESGTLAQTIAEGDMVSDGAGHYSATIPPLSPFHGQAEVHVFIDCPPGTPDQDVTFDIYIDPSGTVVDQSGRPVDGATVTLRRSDSPEGPFTVVPEGSDLMSPANRSNPMTTGGTGRFGWDTVAGYYTVTAAKAGCTAADGSASASTDVLEVPPPVTDLRLVLDCPVDDTTPPTLTVTPLTLEGNTTGGYSGDLSGVTAEDPDDPAADVTLTDDAPDLLPLGTTTVTWTATDAAGNSATATQRVTVRDTTAPALACPAPRRAQPDRDVGSATVRDIVDASPRVSNAPPPVPGGHHDRALDSHRRDRQHLHVRPEARGVAAGSPDGSGGDEHSLALLADGTVRAWGAGGNGQLGVNRRPRQHPVTVSGLTGVRSVAAGGLFSLALRGDGTVWAWGDNSQGQLGDGAPRSPRPEAGRRPAAGAGRRSRTHPCPRGGDRRLRVGLGSEHLRPARHGTGSAAPAKVAGLAGFEHVAAGMYHSVALRWDGGVLTWGAGYAGQLGNGAAVNERSAPAVVTGLADVAAIGAGWLNTMAVTTSGAMRAWGDNAYGQIGDSTTTRRASPVAPTGGCLARSATGGDATTYVLCVNGRVLAVGKNASGQLGDGSTTTRRTLVAVTGLGDAVVCRRGPRTLSR